MKQKKFRIGKLDSAGSIASENRKIYCELRRGKIDGPLASRLSRNSRRAEGRHREQRD